MLKQLAGFYFITVFLEGYLCANDTTSAMVEAAFKKFRIVPDVIDKAPKIALKVVYENNKEVNLGKNNFSTLEVALKPYVCYEEDPKDLYTLLLVEPDRPAPECPGLEMLHWQIVNIHGNNISSGFELAFYVQPFALPVAKFRYTFLLLKQEKIFDVDILDIVEYDIFARLCFNTKQFIKENNMEILEGNFFTPVSFLPDLDLSS